MNVLVTGGTGFVGREIVRELQSAGHAIHLLVREPRRSIAPPVPGSAPLLHRGNILAPDALPAACAGMDAIIHLVGIIREAGEQTFENIHECGTHNLVAAAKGAGVKRFLHMSALGTRPNAAARYHQSKWAAEETVRRSDLDWTIFRPSIIYGPGDGFVNLFARIARLSPLVPIMGNGQSKFQPLPVANVAAAFVKSLDEPRAVGRTFDLCGGETLTLNEIVEAILSATKRQRLKVHVPMGLARVQAAILEFLFARLLRIPPPLNRDQLLMLQEDNVGDGSPARELFGLKPLLFHEGIARYLGT